MLKALSEEIYEHNIPGNVAELGVYRGDFAKHINRFFPDKKLYLFDTFSGFNQNDIQQENSLGITLKQGEFEDISQIDILKYLSEKMPYPHNIEIHKGYFPETTNGVEDNFCFVSLDPDLYNPTLSGLEYFYPRLNKGGYIAIHDFGTYRFAGVRKAVYDFCSAHSIPYVPMQDRGLSVIIAK